MRAARRSRTHIALFKALQCNLLNFILSLRSAKVD